MITYEVITELSGPLQLLYGGMKGDTAAREGNWTATGSMLCKAIVHNIACTRIAAHSDIQLDFAVLP